MHLSKKVKIYIFVFILLSVGIFFVSKVASKSISYSATQSAPLSANVNTISTTTQTPSSTPENTKGYKVDKYFRVVPIDPKDNKKVVLLTIDNGPSKQSIQILDILDKHNIKAIFFINGIHHKANPSVINEEFKRGHSIGNHTWGHQNLKKISEETAKKEIDSNTKLIFETVGENPKFFRAPFGINSDFSRTHTKQEGMLSMNWSASPKDWEKASKNKEVFINNVMKTLHDGDIILMHENTWSRDALENLILAIQSKGYTFIDPKEITQ